MPIGIAAEFYCCIESRRKVRAAGNRRVQIIADVGHDAPVRFGAEVGGKFRISIYDNQRELTTIVPDQRITGLDRWRSGLRRRSKTCQPGDAVWPGKECLINLTFF